MSIDSIKAGLISPNRQDLAQRPEAGKTSTSFQATLTLQIAQMRAQNFDTLVPPARQSGGNGTVGSSAFDAVLGHKGLPSGVAGGSQNMPSVLGAGSAIDAISYLPGLRGGVSEVATVGRNLSLFDPESAYRMMSLINQKEASYKAESVELRDLRENLTKLQAEAGRLRELDANAAASEFRTRLERFTEAYNDWIRRFDGELGERGGTGTLAGSEAARVAHWELRQSVEYVFHGASSGMREMADLGISIDPTTRLARFDPQRLDAALEQNRPGVAATLREFGTSFARSAELLNANNFIPNRLGQLDRVLGYLRDNMESLRTEFGQGDSVAPTGRTAEAIRRYEASQAA